jgi:hypothetical protein
VIEEAPIQLYSSALVFAPEKSIVRTQFKRIQKKTKSARRLECSAPDVRGSHGHCKFRSLLIRRQARV